MRLTEEMQAYIDGYSDGYSRGFQDAVVAEASKVRIEVRGDGCNAGDLVKQNFSSGLSSSSSPSGSSEPLLNETK